MTRGAFVLTLFLLSTGCSVDNGDEGYRPTSAELRDLVVMCEEHDRGAGSSSTPTSPAPGAEVCGLVVLIDVFGSSCPDFATLKASWQRYFTEGGEPEGLCNNLR